MSEFNVWLQSRLTSHGFTPGPIDGVIGPNTIAALRAFQKSHNLVVSGKATKPTIDKLRMTSVGGFSFDRSRLVATGSPPSSPWPHQNDANKFYGKVGTNQTKITPPWQMRLAWDKTKFISGMTLHERVASSALRAMNRVYDRYGDEGVKRLGLDLFGGSLNVRRMRGGNKMSTHSWGIAIDFDPERNGLRVKAPKARLSREDVVPFWECWEDEGWISLGRMRNFDWMHVQAATI